MTRKTKRLQEWVVALKSGEFKRCERKYMLELSDGSQANEVRR